MPYSSPLFYSLLFSFSLLSFSFSQALWLLCMPHHSCNVDNKRGVRLADHAVASPSYNLATRMHVSARMSKEPGLCTQRRRKGLADVVNTYTQRMWKRHLSRGHVLVHIGSELFMKHSIGRLACSRCRRTSHLTLLRSLLRAPCHVTISLKPIPASARPHIMSRDQELPLRGMDAKTIRGRGGSPCRQ